ncbi:2-C-methyl-D-erythritol 4-phosphate cytidylyltransferase [Candidatus Beckwithbacteria bacterium RBG_13_42_9]|uniref:2-C-methyl-D-erythritol 4-phosphate cytidylyltransferase n=1 Tax=Candidatus Beckwithbacteria bacterium RBG_13_42_9 TaxID=1797457 RepID=A0A1F5E4V9_9BACT|nr:MAG: 2-C-methyl-D-erythritol 4-phosphate cytidylyltransferase [Candidatus Beckwithbacteria bacterium RBG_13_42_9]
MDDRSTNWVIIVAGGNGERIHLGYNKVFASVAGRPILYWTLKQFQRHPKVNKIIISIKKEDKQRAKKIVLQNNFSKVVQYVNAGESRQDSTHLALKKIKKEIKEADLVGVHNAVNPFVLDTEISEVFSQAKKYQAALLARPATDTVKITNGHNLVYKTPLREKTWYAQTPQVSTFANLWQAFQKAATDKFSGTDDSQLLERIDIKSKIVPCSYLNIKITFPQDLVLAEKIIKEFYD